MICALGFVWRLCISLDLTSISVLAPCADLLEKGWGWQRLVPYSDGNVDWTIFKEYLREYFIQNAGEIPALCASKKPEKDKNYFCRNASKFAARHARNKVNTGQGRNASGYILNVVADMVMYSWLCKIILLPIRIDLLLQMLISTVPPMLKIDPLQCVQVEHNFRFINRRLLVDEDITLSRQIEELQIF